MASELDNFLRCDESDHLIFLHQDSEDFRQNFNVKKGINYRMCDYDYTPKEKEKIRF